MNLTNYNNVGTIHLERIEELNNQMDDLNNQKLIEQDNLLQAQVTEALGKHEGLNITSDHVRLTIKLNTDNWGDTASIYINDRYDFESNKRVYYMRHQITSNNGYSDDEKNDLEAYALAVSLMPQAMRQFEMILLEWVSIEKRYDERGRALRDQKRQLIKERNQLIDMARAENEKIFMEILENGWTVPKDARKLYTGYGENYEFVEHLTLKKNSVKSVLLTDRNTWSDGTTHPVDYRYKKEDLFDDMYRILLKQQEEETASEN